MGLNACGIKSKYERQVFHFIDRKSKMKDRTKIKGFLFDMDGTLLDTERLYHDCWLKVARERGFIMTEDMMDRMRGLALPKAKKVFEDANPGRDFTTEREFRMKMVYEHIDRFGVPKKPGLDRLFQWLHEKSYKIALASSSPEKQVLRYMDSINYREQFDLICAGDRITNGKPAPDIFLYCAEKIGLLPSECAVVEDSFNGIEAGKRAGCFVIGIPDLNDLSPVRELMDAELSGLADIIDFMEQPSLRTSLA